MRKYLYFLKYLRKGKKYFIIAFLCGLGYGAMSGLGIPVIFEKVFKKVFEAGEASYSSSEIVLIGCLLPAIFLIRGIFSFLNGYFMSFTGMIIMKELRGDIFTRIQFLPMKFFDKNTQGDLIARMANDPGLVQEVVLQLAVEIFKQPTQMIAAFGTLLYVCLQYKSYLLIPLFFIAIFLGSMPIRAIKRNLRSRGSELQNMSGGILQQISENLDAVSEIRSFGLEAVQIKKHSSFLEQAKTIGLKLVKYERLQQPSMEFISATIISVVFVYARYINMPFSAFSAIGLALYFATDPLKRIGALLNRVHISEGAVDRIQYILDMPICIKDAKGALPLGRSSGFIEFKQVNFSYDTVPTLIDVNASIKGGAKVALVGHSGAGKSTFAKLISRFYDVNNGEICVDGVSIKKYRVEDLRKNIATVPQYPVLFNDTIYSNILLGKPDATEDEVFAAAKSAYIHDLIMNFPAGYKTKVGDRGDLLSGGQKQRIAIARAFLKNAPILILDEATSSLDSESEFCIQKSLETLSLNKTVITIAHRLSTIKNADLIILFEQGRVTDQGTHEQLINKNKVYRNFVQKQTLHQELSAIETLDDILEVKSA